MTKEKFINIVNVGKYKNNVISFIIYVCVFKGKKKWNNVYEHVVKGNFRIHLMLTKATNHL